MQNQINYIKQNQQQQQQGGFQMIYDQEMRPINEPLMNQKMQIQKQIDRDREIKEAAEDQQEFNEDEEDLDTYQSCLQKCGNWCGCMRTWMPMPCCFVAWPYKLIRQSQEGLVTRFGKYKRTLKAGLHYWNVMSEQIEVVDMRIKVSDLQKQSVLTKDNLSITIDANVFWKIVNPRRAKYKVDNVEESITYLTFQTVRNVAGQHTLQELLEHRTKVTEVIEKMVEEHVQVWGAKIESIFIKDIMLPLDSMRTLASAAKEKRTAESKIIAAQAEVEAAKLMQQSAGILSISSAMQIRYFETIQRITRCPNNTKIIFLPFDESGSGGDQLKAIKQ